MTMIETAIPDDEYQQQGYPVHLWSEPITAQTSRRGFGSLGLDVIGYKYPLTIGSQYWIPMATSSGRCDALI